MAAIIGFGGTTWTNYENNRSYPGLEDFIKICKYFEVSETDLLHNDLKEEGNLTAKPDSNENVGDGNVIGKGIGNRLTYPNSSKTALSVVNEPSKSLLRMPKVITVDSQGKENVVLVPVKARAGYLNGYGDPKFIEKLPAYRLPWINNGTHRIFEVEGMSMHDTLYPGDGVICSFVEDFSHIRDGYVYTVITRNEGVVIKRVLNRINSDGKLILKSDNYRDRSLYPNIVIEPDDILELWFGVVKLTRQFSQPLELYKRVVDLEGRLTLLENGITKKLK